MGMVGFSKRCPLGPQIITKTKANEEQNTLRFKLYTEVEDRNIRKLGHLCSIWKGNGGH